MKKIKQNDSYNDLDTINDNDFEISLSDFEEKEYNLTGIGMEGFFLTIEQYNNYLWSEDGFVFNFMDFEEFKRYLNSVNDYFIIYDEDEQECMVTEEQLKEIGKILT